MLLRRKMMTKADAFDFYATMEQLVVEMYHRDQISFSAKELLLAVAFETAAEMTDDDADEAPDPSIPIWDVDLMEKTDDNQKV